MFFFFQRRKKVSNTTALGDRRGPRFLGTAGARYELFSRAMQSKPIHKEKIKELQSRVAANCRALGKTSVADLRAMVTTAANQMSNTQLAQRVQSQARRWTKPQLCSWLSCNGEVAVDEVPKSFLDGVTFAVMLDPHIIVDSGHSFDRGTIDKLGRRCHQSPIRLYIFKQNSHTWFVCIQLYSITFNKIFKKKKQPEKIITFISSNNHTQVASNIIFVHINKIIKKTKFCTALVTLHMDPRSYFFFRHNNKRKVSPIQLIATR